MAKEENGLFVCGVCGLRYMERGWAEKCEAFCREHGGLQLGDN